MNNFMAIKMKPEPSSTVIENKNDVKVKRKKKEVNPPLPPVFINLEVATKIFGIAPIELQKAAIRGEIPAYKFGKGRRWFFKPEDLEAHFQKWKPEVLNFRGTF